MTTPQCDYWTECVETAFENEGIKATPKQIDGVAGAFEGAHDNYGLAFYTPSGPSQDSLDLAEARRELMKERAKMRCTHCKGRGAVLLGPRDDPFFVECFECKGEGRY